MSTVKPYSPVNLEVHILKARKKYKQRSDGCFLLHTITTNVAESFTKGFHREASDFVVLRRGVQTQKITRKSPKNCAKSKKNCIVKLALNK